MPVLIFRYLAAYKRTNSKLLNHLHGIILKITLFAIFSVYVDLYYNFYKQ